MRFFSFPAIDITATTLSILCLATSSLNSASPLPNPQQPTETASITGTEPAEATPTATPEGVPVVLSWYPEGGALAPSIPPGNYQILGEGGTETTLYYAGPGYSIAGTSFVPVTHIVTDIAIVGPSQFEAYNLVSDAAIGIECSIDNSNNNNNNNNNRANCVARIKTNANAEPIVQTANGIPGVPTTIYAQPTTLASPLQIPDLSSAAETAALGKTTFIVGLAAVAVVALV